MFLSTWQNRSLGLVVGLIFGVLAGGLWPNSPAHAVATDRHENFAICTAMVDENQNLEAVFFLDFLTCELKTSVVLPQTNEFTPIFTRDISKDLNIEPTQQPHFLMVSGRYRLQPNTDMPRGAQSLLYVAELNTGRMISYACGKINNGPAYIKPLASIQFRDQSKIRPGGLVPPGGAVGLDKTSK